MTDPSDFLSSVTAAARHIVQLEEQVAHLTTERIKLQAFKDFVHKRLDDAGVPADPPGEHRDRGCRVGQRLDVLIGERDGLRAFRRRTFDSDPSPVDD
jgi:hypothetical protein